MIRSIKVTIHYEQPYGNNQDQRSYSSTPLSLEPEIIIKKIKIIKNFIFR